MISFVNLFEDIQQPPQQPGQPVQPVQQQPVQKPGLWNKIKSGYDSINQKYENAVDATKNALLSPAALNTVGMVGMSLMPFSPAAGVVGMGAMQAGRAIGAVRSAQALANQTRQQYQQANQQPVRQ